MSSKSALLLAASLILLLGSSTLAAAQASGGSSDAVRAAAAAAVEQLPREQVRPAPVRPSHLPQPGSVTLTRGNVQRVVHALHEAGLNRKQIHRWIHASLQATAKARAERRAQRRPGVRPSEAPNPRQRSYQSRSQDADPPERRRPQNARKPSRVR